MSLFAILEAITAAEKFIDSFATASVLLGIYEEVKSFRKGNDRTDKRKEKMPCGPPDYQHLGLIHQRQYNYQL